MIGLHKSTPVFISHRTHRSKSSKVVSQQKNSYHLKYTHQFKKRGFHHEDSCESTLHLFQPQKVLSTFNPLSKQKHSKKMPSRRSKPKPFKCKPCDQNLKAKVSPCSKSALVQRSSFSMKWERKKIMTCSPCELSIVRPVHRVASVYCICDEKIHLSKRTCVTPKAVIIKRLLLEPSTQKCHIGTSACWKLPSSPIRAVIDDVTLMSMLPEKFYATPSTSLSASSDNSTRRKGKEIKSNPLSTREQWLIERRRLLF